MCENLCILYWFLLWNIFTAKRGKSDDFVVNEVLIFQSEPKCGYNVR